MADMWYGEKRMENLNKKIQYRFWSTEVKLCKFGNAFQILLEEIYQLVNIMDKNMYLNILKHKFLKECSKVEIQSTFSNFYQNNTINRKVRIARE